MRIGSPRERPNKRVQLFEYRSDVLAALRERDAVAYEADSAHIDALARLLRVDFEFDDRLRLVELDAQAQVRKNRRAVTVVP